MCVRIPAAKNPRKSFAKRIVCHNNQWHLSGIEIELEPAENDPNGWRLLRVRQVACRLAVALAIRVLPASQA